MKIQLEPVKSSQVEAIGYDAPTKTMRVRFKAGDTYDYQNVSGQIHAQIVSAPSIGRAINQTLKKNPKAYPFRKIEPQETV